MENDYDKGKAAEESKKFLVQMKLSSKTISRVERIKKLTGISNRTQLVAQAIALYEIFLEAVDKQGSFIIEYPNGKKERLIFNI